MGDCFDFRFQACVDHWANECFECFNCRGFEGVILWRFQAQVAYHKTPLGWKRKPEVFTALCDGVLTRLALITPQRAVELIHIDIFKITHHWITFTIG